MPAKEQNVTISIKAKLYPDLYLSDVNDNPAKSKQAGAINFEVA